MPDDNLRTRIAAALQNHRQGQVGGGWLTCSCDEHWSRFSPAVYDGHVADAVMKVITVHVPPIVASAIHSWADSELAAISHHGTDGEYEMLKRLNQEAAQIANYATTHERWNGPNA